MKLEKVKREKVLIFKEVMNNIKILCLFVFFDSCKVYGYVVRLFGFRFALVIF